MSKPVIISDNRIINTSAENAYQKLIDPAEQVKWNTLYLEASLEPKGEIKNGSVMTGNFKASGRATVIFQNVKPNKEFTHYSKMKMFNLFNLGEFHHNYANCFFRTRKFRITFKKCNYQQFQEKITRKF
jgi:hypothetical protein